VKPDQPVLAVSVGDRLTLAKQHPCGAREWQVSRVGADIGLNCEGCGRRVLLERRELERRFRGFIDRAGQEADPQVAQ
jgi:hypothetical protein